MSLWKNILPVTIGIGVLLVLFVWVLPAEQSLQGQQDSKKLEELEYHNTMLLEVNTILEDRIFLLEAQTDSLQQVLAENNQNISTLKKRKDEKIHRMDRYTDDALFQYFATFNTTSSTDKE